MLAVLILSVMFLRRLAVDGSHLTRLLIASAREFIADAEAARLTQNPAALVSALRRIEGRSVIQGLAAGQDAMMIDGAHEGAFATHPTIAERVAAIISVTGSMAVIAPARRDTRPRELRASEGFGRRPGRPRSGIFACRAAGCECGACAGLLGQRVQQARADARNVDGRRCGRWVFLWAHSADLASRRHSSKPSTPLPWGRYSRWAGKQARCQMQGLGSVVGLAAKPTGCSEMDKMLAAHRGEDGLIGKLAESMAEQTKGMYDVARRDLQKRCAAGRPACRGPGARCFQTELLGGRPRSARGDRAAGSDEISLPRYLAYGDAAARRVAEASSAERDSRSSRLFQSPQDDRQVIHRFFGDPGLQVAAARNAGPEHQTAIALLREQLTVPGFASALNAMERADSSFSPQLRRTSSPASPAGRRAKEGLNGGSSQRQSGLWQHPTSE